MNPADTFFLAVLAAVLCIRLFLFFRPTPGPTLGSWRIHHYHFGIVLGLVGWLAHSVILYGIGTGLFVDELAYLILRGKTHQDNYSWPSLIGTAICLAIVYLLRRDLLFFS